MFNGRIPIDKDARVKTNGRYMTGEEVLLEKIQKIEEDIKYIKQEMVIDSSSEDIVDIKREIDEIKEEIFSLTMQVERLLECEKMEQEEKLEKKYIVHRRSETGVELYIGHPFIQVVALEKPVFEITDDRCEAQEFTQEMAIKIRNEKNKHYKYCLMLWVISEVK